MNFNMLTAIKEFAHFYDMERDLNEQIGLSLKHLDFTLVYAIAIIDLNLKTLRFLMRLWINFPTR